MQRNDVSIDLPGDLPAFVIVSNGKLSVYSRDVKATLVEWIRTGIGQNEL